MVPLQEELVAGYRPALLALTVATLLILMIASINVAGLLLARGSRAGARSRSARPSAPAAAGSCGSS